MMYETTYAPCPPACACRYRLAGASAAEIAYWAVHRRDVGTLMRRYPGLGVDDVRQGVERYIACPCRQAGEAVEEQRPAWSKVA